VGAPRNCGSETGVGVNSEQSSVVVAGRAMEDASSFRPADTVPMGQVRSCERTYQIFPERPTPTRWQQW
jgi:hypothetical protein